MRTCSPSNSYGYPTPQSGYGYQSPPQQPYGYNQVRLASLLYMLLIIAETVLLGQPPPPQHYSSPPGQGYYNSPPANYRPSEQAHSHLTCILKAPSI